MRFSKQKTLALAVATVLLLFTSFASAQDDAAAEVQQATDSAEEAKKSSEQAQKQSAETAEKADQAQEKVEQAAEKAQETSTDLQQQLDAQAALIATQTASGAEVSSSLAELQRILNEQKQLIEKQKAEIAKQQEQIDQQQAQLQTTGAMLTSLQSQIDQLSDQKQQELSEEDIAMRERLAALETQVGRIPDDPSAMLEDEDFPGAIRVPGTTAAYKIGGFVKAALVKNFDPLVTQDRFIVGSIPVTDDDQIALASETSLTANQTRVNFDYRQKRESGDMRAFIEGDFFGAGNTFRLRHAFGQYRDLLAGKTWSAFYDAEASPEEVDFEGINGHVVVRQTQLRYFPKIGKDWRWMISLEDPNPQVTGGEGVSDVPDLVTSIRRNWFGGWHVKTALLLRQIRAIPNAGVDTNGQPCDPTEVDLGCVAINSDGSTQRDYGWALTASGKVQVPWFDKRDNFLFQLNYGEGLGRYLTDLSSIQSLGIDGGKDGVINPANGELKALPIFGGYLAFQHWWSKRMRSTFITSLVNIDNFDFQNPTSYKQTQRASANFIWSPISSLDLGAEFLWGKRVNESSFTNPETGVNNPGSGTATQLQLEAKYRF